VFSENAPLPHCEEATEEYEMNKILMGALAASVALALPMLGASPASAVCRPAKHHHHAISPCELARRPAPQVIRHEETLVAPARTPVAIHPGPGPAPIIIEYGDPYVMQAARDGCPICELRNSPKPRLLAHPEHSSDEVWKAARCHTPK
jgi:hypothetical protein